MNKRKKIFISCLIIGILVIGGVFAVISSQLVGKNSSSKFLGSSTVIDKNYEQSKEDIANGDNSTIIVPDDKNDNEISLKDIKLFVNQSAIVKTKEISGETTLFNISFRLFALNNSKNEISFLTNGFSGKYNIGSCGSLFTFSCLSSEKSITLKPNEIQDLDFVISYVITDNETFNDNEKYDLVIDYMLDEIFSQKV